jgi:pimeloyl-ACP methyl ester carboxylesterase
MTPLGDTGLEYDDRGKGQPLLLIHAGVFADWFGPLAASTALASNRVIRVRRAGYGAIQPKTPLSIAAHADHLRQLAEQLGLDKIHIVGHSSGALIALELAAAQPTLVQTLMLIEPAACGPFQAPAFAEIRELFIGPAMAHCASGDISAAFDSFMLGVCGQQYRHVIQAALGEGGYSQAVAESKYFFQEEGPAAMQWQFSQENAAKVHQPVLVIEGAAGRDEGPLSQQVTELTLKLLPQSEVLLVQGSNHLLPLQDPEALGTAIKEFLARNSN